MLGIITSRMATSGCVDSIRERAVLPSFGLDNVVALETEGTGQGVADGPIIVGNQYTGAHWYSF